MIKIFHVQPTISAYPKLTVQNQFELNKLLTELSQQSPSLSTQILDNLDWSKISPNGNSDGLCSRNALAIGADKSRFYKDCLKNSYTLEQSSIYLLDYYERCKHITKLGVLLTDVWRPGTLSRWSHIYEMYDTMGIQSVALLYSGHQITPIRWPWS
jgi:hypothetical protein